MDGLEKVTGAAKFGADIHLPGMLHGKMLTSPHAHARILSIDTSDAEAVPGVKAVITARDFPIFEQQQAIDFIAEQFRGARVMAEHFMARDKALYLGHPVAAIAATSPHIAEEAAKPAANPKDPSNYYRVPRPGILWNGYHDDTLPKDGGKKRRLRSY